MTIVLWLFVAYAICSALQNKVTPLHEWFSSRVAFFGELFHCTFCYAFDALIEYWESGK